MTWYEKVKIGMELMKEGCEINRDSKSCDKFCPFAQYCLYSEIPKDWQITEK